AVEPTPPAGPPAMTQRSPAAPRELPAPPVPVALPAPLDRRSLPPPAEVPGAPPPPVVRTEAPAPPASNRLGPTDEDDAPAAPPSALPGPPPLPARTGSLYEAALALRSRNHQDAARALQLIERHRSLHPDEAVEDALGLAIEATARLDDPRAARF